MQSISTIWPDPATHLRRQYPDAPQFYFAPAELHRTARHFQRSFPGLVTYAVKANPAPAVLDNLVAAGLTAFDVASPEEMRVVRAARPDAVLHYNNPVRSPDEVAFAVAMGVASYSVDDAAGLDSLAKVPEGTEVSVRLALPVEGAAYHFGEKFGADPRACVDLLRAVAVRGLRPAMTFHPGTMCTDPAAWRRYIAACAEIARTAGVELARINVGGGFAVARRDAPAPVERVFAAITDATRTAFGAKPPDLVCEPGRAMVADAFALGLRVKAVRNSGAVVLNDGIYGALAEWKDIGASTCLRVLTPEGAQRQGGAKARVVFGPTCDSLDRLPDPVDLPDDIAPGDYLLISGMGAYSLSLTTQFNGYGARDIVTVSGFSDRAGAGLPNASG